MADDKAFVSGKATEETAWQANRETMTAALKPCNPSVCVGGAQPTSCYCPTTQHK